MRRRRRRICNAVEAFGLNTTLVGTPWDDSQRRMGQRLDVRHTTICTIAQLHFTMCII